jgi:hypothetical protein
MFKMHAGYERLLKMLAKIHIFLVYETVYINIKLLFGGGCHPSSLALKIG